MPSLNPWKSCHKLRTHDVGEPLQMYTFENVLEWWRRSVSWNFLITFEFSGVCFRFHIVCVWKGSLPPWLSFPHFFHSSSMGKFFGVYCAIVLPHKYNHIEHMMLTNMRPSSASSWLFQLSLLLLLAAIILWRLSLSIFPAYRVLWDDVCVPWLAVSISWNRREPE